MDEKKRVLLVTQEMNPYMLESAMADIVRQFAAHLQNNEFEIRVLMPRFGLINERRHRLHEVVRLSGINIIIDDDDYPLIIKVASLPGARMQVYFLDNEDFFKRNEAFEDKDGNLFDDSADRTVFFSRGVIETVKKFGWAPDIVHCHGWMTSLIPAYLKTAYKKDPIFAESKVVFSAYSAAFEGELPGDFQFKSVINRVSAEDIVPYGKATAAELTAGAMHYSDAVILGDEKLDEKTQAAIDALGDKPILTYQGEDEYLESFVSFFKELLPQEEEA